MLNDSYILSLISLSLSLHLVHRAQRGFTVERRFGRSIIRNLKREAIPSLRGDPPQVTSDDRLSFRA